MLGYGIQTINHIIVFSQCKLNDLNKRLFFYNILVWNTFQEMHVVSMTIYFYFFYSCLTTLLYLHGLIYT